MSEIKKSTIPDEMVDEELQSVGVKFKDLTREHPEAECDPAEEAPEKVRSVSMGIGRALTALCGLVAADGLLIFMCTAHKIELIYGLVFLAAASAFFGGKVSRACM